MDVTDSMPSATDTGPAPAPGKVLRVPNLKRGRNDDAPLSERVQLERVLGLTVGSNAALACSPLTELTAYPAGCTVVLLHNRKGRQSHLLNTSRKTVTSLAFSADGRYLATGECGHQPSVRVWDLQAEPLPVPVAELAGHKYGVSCVAFSPNHKHVVSVGTQHDMIVNVWDWRAGVKVASNKVSTKVKAVSFADNGSYFVTVGNRHVKFWYLEHSRSAKYKEPVPLMGRSAILGEQRNNYFCDVGCGRGEMGDSTYAITKSGLLCEFNNRRLLDKWVELRTTSANCLAVGERCIVIGCADGIIRCFDPATLQFVTTLPRTHYLGVDVAQGLSIAHMAVPPKQARYPDAVAITLDEIHGKVTCVYNDHSLYVWDVRDIRRVGKSQSFLYHSACIWGVEMYPELQPSVQSILPPGSFLTCSSDDTIRLWHLDPTLPADSQYQRNIYSNELLKVLYIDPELGFIKDLDVSATSEKPDASYDGRNGVRSIRVSPDGTQLASGDRAGNVRIHDLRTVEEICRIEAHDAEVLCLEFSPPESGHRLLASASRDRLIHVFNVDQDYNFLQTLDDHSSSITAVRFLQQPIAGLGMASCGADKSIIFRQLQPGSPPQFARGHNVAGKTTLYDMEVDASQKHVLTACQDRNIRVYNISSGKHSKTFKGSASDDGSLIKVVLDSSGIYLATSCTDKTLSVYDYYSGECLATMLGHSELVTGLRFTNDGRRLVSASGDGCLFVWRLPHDMVVTMQARRSQQAARSKRSVPLLNGHHDEMDSLSGSPTNSLHMHDLQETVQQHDYRFNVGSLPLWAKKQMQQDVSPNVPSRQMDLPKGRWAQRLDAGGITVKSVYDSDSIIPFPSLQQGLRAESDGSKESSMDSSSETRTSFTMRRESLVERNSQQFSPCPESLQQITSGQPGGGGDTGKVNFTRGSEMLSADSRAGRPLTDESSLGSYRYEEGEDGDVEDYSEGEGESTEPEQAQRLVYYPPVEDTGSDYTVNAMDVEELRRSQRRHKKARPERLTDLPSIAVSGSQDSEDDDEEASTPSAETAERNLLSLLSVSSESLDRMGQREQFLKNNFESLSGAEQNGGAEEGGTSISSQFLTRSNVTPRNVALITAARQTRQDAESVRRREELQRRIEDTRRKLQSVGYRSGLSSSQSITDLSHIPEKDFNSSPARPQGTGLKHARSVACIPQTLQHKNNGPKKTSGKLAIPAGYNRQSHQDNQEPGSGGLRRAISLSDLSAPPPRRPNTLHVSGKVPSNTARPNPAGTNTRTLPRPGHKLAPPPSSGMSRSSSVGVLNQGEDDPLRSRPLAARHTISSQNKMAASQAARERRRSAALSASAGNLQGMQTAGTEDSSSEETAPTPPMQGGKPAIAPRPRNIPISNGPVAPPRGLGRTAREVTQRLAGGGKGRAPAPPPPTARANMEVSPEELPVKDTDTDIDIGTAPITLELCQRTAEQLIRSAEAVATLHKRASVEIEPSERAGMLQNLGAAAIQAQRTLRMVAPGTPSLSEAQPPTGEMVHMMQQYSDMLVSIVQQRMAKPPPS